MTVQQRLWTELNLRRRVDLIAVYKHPTEMVEKMKPDSSYQCTVEETANKSEHGKFLLDIQIYLSIVFVCF